MLSQEHVNMTTERDQIRYLRRSQRTESHLCEITVVFLKEISNFFGCDRYLFSSVVLKDSHRRHCAGPSSQHPIKLSKVALI